MMDITPTNKERVERINRSNETSEENAVKWVEVTRVRDADIEDLFEPNFYLKLVNLAYHDELEDPLTMKAISESNPRIVERIKSHFNSAQIAGGNFDRYRPAAYLLENFDKLKYDIGDDTIGKIASLIGRINGLLPGATQNGHVNGNGDGVINISESQRIMASS